MIRVLACLWASPNSLLGLLAALPALEGGRWRLRQGVVEAWGGWLPGQVEAITLGHVIIARDAARLDRWRDHERRHVRQYELLGPAFLPVYLLLALWAALRGRHPYRDHPLELSAGLRPRVRPAQRRPRNMAR